LIYALFTPFSVYLTPCVPLSFKGEGGGLWERDFVPPEPFFDRSVPSKVYYGSIS